MNSTNEDESGRQQYPTDLNPSAHYKVRHHRKPTKYETYEYTALKRKQGAIRLLKLLPSTTPDSNVSCELIPLEDPANNPGYEALSWCWGTDEKKVEIFIWKRDRMCTKLVSPNLALALKALRYEDRFRYIWVDAVCIDQEDLDEKNHQVEMMWDIYGNATGVCIWLGEANDASRIALKFINEEVLKLRDFDELCDRPDASKKWRSLLELMQRPWFSRRWVVQEIALARSAVIYCGEDQISWKDFAIAVELFVEVETATHRLSEVMRKESKEHHVPGLFDHVSALGASLLVDATDRLFRDYKQEHDPLPEDENSSDSDFSESDLDEPPSSSAPKSRPPGSTGSTRGREVNGGKKTQMQPLLTLEYLVSSLTIFETTVPHDTIYALLAIAKDTTPRAAPIAGTQSTDHVQKGLEVYQQRKRYNVNYKLPYVDVCKDFIQFAIERSLRVDPSRALDVICRPWAIEEKALEARRRAVQKEKEKKERNEARNKKKMKKRQASKMAATNGTSREENMQKIDDAEAKKDNPTADPHHDMPLPSWIPQLSNAPFGMYQLAGVSGPKMSRKNADPLVGSPISTVRSYAAAETKKIDMKALKFRKRHDLGDSRHYSMYVRGFHLDTIIKVEQVARNGQIPQEWAELAGWEDIKKLPPEAFWRTLVADRGSDGRNPPVYYSRACCECFKKGGYESGAVSTADLINYERNSVVSQFCRRVHAVIWNRALIKTDKGRLGLVGKDVKEGDQVCILYGLSVPVVLKKSEKKQEDVYKLELAWELRHMVGTVQRFYGQYVARKKQHKRRKEKEMVKLCRQWLDETNWLQEKGTNKHPTKQKTKWTKPDYLGVLKGAVASFHEWRISKRASEWKVIEGKLKDEKEKEKQLNSDTNVPSANGPQPSTARNGVTQTSRRDSQQVQAGGKATDRPRHGKRLHVDWWEFDFQLKYGRRWKKEVKERKVRVLKEWETAREMERMAKMEARKLEVQQLRELEREMQQSREPGREETLYEHREESSAGSSHNGSTFPSRTETLQASGTSSFQPVKADRNKTGLSNVFVGQQNAMDKMEDIVLPASTIVYRTILNDAIHTEPDSVAGAEGSASSASDHSEAPNGVEPLPEVKSTPNSPHINGNAGLAADTKICNAKNCGQPREKITVKDAEGFLKAVVDHPSRCIQDVLDNMKKKRGDEGYYSYQLMGECYVHGMMDGEAMFYQNEEDIHSAVFEIR